VRFSRRRPDGPDDLDLDRHTAERLLDGSLTPDDAPPGYGPVAAVLAAASAASGSAELAGEDDARARYAATSAAAAPAAPARPSRAVVAVVAVTLVLGGTASAAAVGRLPGPAQDAVADALDGVGVSIPRGDGNGTAVGGAGGENRGPNPTGPAAHGLCTAYAADQGGENDARLDSVAFQALLAIVGESEIVDFCERADPGPAVPPGQGGTPPGQVDNPGQGGTPPGQGGTPPGQGGTPPGQGGTPPGQLDNPGQGGTPPGQGGTPAGQGGSPPGQVDNPGDGRGNPNGNGNGGGNGNGNGGGNGPSLDVPGLVGGLPDALGIAGLSP